MADDQQPVEALAAKAAGHALAPVAPTTHPRQDRGRRRLPKLHGAVRGDLEGAKLFAAFGNDDTAVVVYDTKTAPVASAPGAEYVTVENGKIIRSRFIFGRAPFQAAARETAT